jgi:hypothetical protein
MITHVEISPRKEANDIKILIAFKHNKDLLIEIAKDNVTFYMPTSRQY